MQIEGKTVRSRVIIRDLVVHLRAFEPKRQDAELKILGLPVSQRMRALAKNIVYRDKIDVDSFHKGIQYAVERIHINVI